MSNTDKLREFAEKYKNGGYRIVNDYAGNKTMQRYDNKDELLSDLTALIDKVIEERMPSEDEIEQWMQENRWASARQYVKWLRSRLTCSEKPNNSQKTEGGEG